MLTQVTLFQLSFSANRSETQESIVYLESEALEQELSPHLKRYMREGKWSYVLTSYFKSSHKVLKMASPDWDSYIREAVQ